MIFFGETEIIQELGGKSMKKYGVESMLWGVESAEEYSGDESTGLLLLSD